MHQAKLETPYFSNWCTIGARRHQKPLAPSEQIVYVDDTPMLGIFAGRTGMNEERGHEDNISGVGFQSERGLGERATLGVIEWTVFMGSGENS